MKIIGIKDTNERTRNNLVFEIQGQTKDGAVYSGTITRKTKPDWLNQEIELEITKQQKKVELYRLHLENQIEQLGKKKISP